MSTDPTLVAENTPPRRSSAPSLVPDEWGGSDLANPELSRMDFAAARSNVQLINQVVRSRGGSSEVTEPLVLDTLRRLSERGPFGHVGNAFLYGATSELLERATQMSPNDFNQYLRTIDHRQNPINVFERTALDQLTDDSKQATLRHIAADRGQQDFRWFGAMEGQNGPLAFSAGAADAVVQNYAGGARDLLAIAGNPLEAGRQFTNLTSSADKLPQAVQQAYRELQTEIGRWGESDYRKGYLSAQAVMTALDVRDAAESVGRLGHLASEMHAGRVTNLADALTALEHGRSRHRADNDPAGASRVPGGDGVPSRTPSPAPAPAPDLSSPGVRRQLPDGRQAALISDGLRFDGALGRELNGGIERWAQGKPDNAIENLRSSPQTLYGRGNGDIGLIGEAYLRAANVADADLPAARRALGEVRDAMNGRSTEDYARLYRNLMDPQSGDRGIFDGLVANARRGLEVERVRDASVAQGVVIDATGRPRPVFGTARTGDAVELESGGQRYVAEIRTATSGNGERYAGWGTNERWYPFQDSDRAFNADGSLNRENAIRAVMNDLNTGSARLDALVPRADWQQRRVDEQRLGSVGNAVVFDAGGNPQRVVATAGTGTAIDVVGADRQRRVAEIREGQTADGRRYVGFGTNTQWYPFPDSSGAVGRDGSLDLDNARSYVLAQARQGNINRNALVSGEQWDAVRTPVGDGGLSQANQPVPGTPADPSRTPSANPPPPNVPPPNQTPPPNPSPPGQPPANPFPPNPPPRNESPNALPPASQPNDPLLPYHALPRAERLRAPAPFEVEGRRYDVMGVTGSGELRLRPEGQVVRNIPSEAMFVRQPDGSLLGREVTYQDRTWRFQALEAPGWQPGATERGFRLVDPQDSSRQVFVPDAQANEIRMRFAGQTEFTLGDVRHGVIRLTPAASGEDIGVALRPGMRFEARLRDHELEGPYRISVGDDGRLTATGHARNGNEITRIVQPGEIAPRYVDVRSPDFNDTFQVDAFAHREATLRSRALETEPTGLPLRDPAFGNLAGDSRPVLHRGAESLDAQADFIRRNAGDVPPGQSPSMTVFNIAFSNEGEAQRVLDAMADFRRQHGDRAEIRIVAYEPSFQSFSQSPNFERLQQAIRDNHIQVDFFGGTTSREVIHAKGVIVNDRVLFSTGAVIDGSRNKADISIELPPDAARAFRGYVQEAVIGDAGNSRRQELAAELAHQGVLVNDPEARLPYIARAQDGLIRGAQRELTVSVSELRNPDTTLAIIERARAGVDVQLQYREIDPRSKVLLDQAAQQYPNLRAENVSDWQPRPHFNTIIADGQQAYVGTAYLWPNQQQMVHHGRSFENGVLLQGDAVQSLQLQLDELRRSQRPDLQSNERGQTPAAPVAQSQDAEIRVRLSAAPQPGDVVHPTYQRSREAVERLNAGMNLPYGEASEKLAVAVATVAVQQNLRVDEVAVNKPVPSAPGGTTAFVIERSPVPEASRVSAFPVRQALETPLEVAYGRLDEAAATRLAAAAETAAQARTLPEDNAVRSAPRLA